MNDVWTTVNNMIWNLTHRLGAVDILDILIMAAIIYEALILIRRTRTRRPKTKRGSRHPPGRPST